MKQPSRVSNRLMPAANRTGRDRMAQNGSPLATAVPDTTNKRDFGGGVEPKPEEDADRVHLPGRVDPPGQWREEAVHQPPLVELHIERLVVVPPRGGDRRKPSRRRQGSRR